MKKNDVWNPICVTENREFGHSTLGYIIPCCWYDPVSPGKWLDFSIFTEDLKISNNDSIEDILLSEAWQTFYENLASGPEGASEICLSYCNHSRTTPSTQIKVINLIEND